VADPVNILSLYSGSGMHDEAVCAALRVLGFAPRVLGYVDGISHTSVSLWSHLQLPRVAVVRV
jgi:hypothetical protein